MKRFIESVFGRRYACKAKVVESNASAVAVIGSNSPSASYLLVGAVNLTGGDLRFLNVLDGVDDLAEIYGYRQVVISRYFCHKWLKELQQYREAGGRIVYFMDDDLMDPCALERLPKTYAKKLYKNAARHRSTLQSLCNEFWVSTNYLGEKYRAWNPRVISPRPSAKDLESSVPISICYHGTASHIDEIQWLHRVVSAIQQGQGKFLFEIFGDLSINRLYRELPGTVVLHPMSWANYLAYTSSVRRDIGLAPILDNPFNAGRGPTKFFDFVRMGAVGIYSNVEPYKSFIRNGVDGILLPNSPELWENTIRSISADEIHRSHMVEMARQRAVEMSWNCLSE